jgi:hypothetical protein
MHSRQMHIQLQPTDHFRLLLVEGALAWPRQVFRAPTKCTPGNIQATIGLGEFAPGCQPKKVYGTYIYSNIRAATKKSLWYIYIQ